MPEKMSFAASNHPLTDSLTGIVPKDVDFDAERENKRRKQLCPNEETRKAIEEIEKGVGLSRTLRSIDDLMNDLTRDA